jgi:hypothetical protein
MNEECSKRNKLRSIEKVLKLALSTKNVKERLDYTKMHKDWTVCDWERMAFQ